MSQTASKEGVMAIRLSLARLFLTALGVIRRGYAAGHAGTEFHTDIVQHCETWEKVVPESVARGNEETIEVDRETLAQWKQAFDKASDDGFPFHGNRDPVVVITAKREMDKLLSVKIGAMPPAVTTYETVGLKGFLEAIRKTQVGLEGLRKHYEAKIKDTAFYGTILNLAMSFDMLADQARTRIAEVDFDKKTVSLCIWLFEDFLETECDTADGLATKDVQEALDALIVLAGQKPSSDWKPLPST